MSGLETAPGIAVLSAMITPAVLISACGLLILSTSARLTRVVDRVRALAATLEALFRDAPDALAETRREVTERQLELATERGRLIQGALTSFYVALGVFVGSILAIAAVAFLPALSWGPTALGLLGTLSLLLGCLLLIRETRLAVKAVDLEMRFVLELREAYARRAKA